LLKNDPDGQYTLWVEILEKADLYNTLNINTIYTHFAPINTGVERYLQKLGLSSVAEMSKEDASYLVKYHLIPNAKIDLGQFQSGSINDLNATDDNLYIEFREGGTDAVYLNGEARIRAFDIPATNGIIHSIEDVLEPLTATIYNRLEDPKYTIFLEAVLATGLDEKLNKVYTQHSQSQTILLLKKGYKVCRICSRNWMYLWGLITRIRQMDCIAIWPITY
jgi:hypothetical protein